MTAFQTALFDKADRALRSAAAAVGLGDSETAVNRSYYACFYAAQAALDAQGERPRTHRGTHGRFRAHYVTTGLVSEQVGRTLPHAAQVRERADYDAFAVTDLSAATDLLADAERFVEAARRVTAST
ncbi:HEPN domain-containing protein [Rubrivirga sp. IMCC45206]|uniref:HEPN domain-containing protein n=1 Tax=Rubrivirga sp. IMCC45206 TaxID=3391614 RepID=UPI00398FAB04